MRIILALCLCYVGLTSAFSQELKTKKVIIVTLDGFRWKELYEGVDQKILASKYTRKPELVSHFNDSTTVGSREKLMPFVWSTVAAKGQLYGNRNYKNEVNCKNNHLLSYPGYSEMFVGYPARGVSSNDKEPNPNATVLEVINKHDRFHKRVAAFTTWPVFDFILREEQAGIYVNAGPEPAIGKITQKEEKLNEATSGKGYRSDEQTFAYAFEYLKRERPGVLFIGFDQTDTYAHDGRYDQYLLAANRADAMIADLWQWVQSQPDYKDQTTLFITTDHGRGNGRNSWRNHRLIACGSRHIWFAVMGPDTPAFGELTFKSTFYQSQVAKTIAAFLGVDYTPKRKAGDVVQTMLGHPIDADGFYSSSK